MNIVPLDVTVDRTERRMTIVWSHQHESVYPFEYLRAICPCAHCDTTKHGGLPNTAMKPELFTGIGISDAGEVGHYALRFVWSDGHDAGIYSYEYLIDKCPCELCSNKV